MTICDFCSRQPVIAAYPCQNFTVLTVLGLPAGSEGAWAACADCARLIETDQREALAWRAVNLANRNLIFGETGPVPLPPDEAFTLMRWLHDLFFAHRTGEPVPVGLN